MKKKNIRRFFQVLILCFLTAGVHSSVLAAPYLKVVEREGELECLINREYDAIWKTLSALAHETGQITFENRLSGRIEMDVLATNAHLVLRLEQISLDEGQLRIQALNLRDQSADLHAAREFYKILKKRIRKI